MSSSLQQSAPAVDAVVSNSPVACAQAKKDAQKQRRTGGGAPGAATARILSRDRSANQQCIRDFAREAFNAGRGFSVQVDPKSGLFISFNIFASPSHSHTSREQGQDPCPVPAPQPAWSTPRGKDVLSFDAPSPNANVSRKHGVPRKPRASTPAATPARVAQETPQRSPSAPSPFKQKMKWMRTVFPFNQYEMITMNIIKDCLGACDGDEKQACMKLIAAMITDKFLEEGGDDECALVEKVSAGCTIVGPSLMGIRE